MGSRLGRTMFTMAALAGVLVPAGAQAGDGTFGSTLSGPRNSVAGARSVAVGDFGNDRLQDYVVAGTGSTSIEVTFSGPSGYTTTVNLGAGSIPSDVAIVDLNGDGDEDTVVTDENERVLTFIDDGNTAFPSPAIDAVGVNPRAIAVGDFDRDGDADVAVADRGEGGASIPGGVYIGVNDGNGQLTFGAPLAFTGTYIYDVAVADFNNDGDDDLVVTTVGLDSGVSIRLGAAGATFAPEAAGSHVDVPTSESIAVGDFNGDRNEDVVTTNPDSALGSRSRVRYGDGDGTFSTGPLTSASNGPYSVLVGAFNDDYGLDFASINRDSATVSPRLNDNAGGFTIMAGETAVANATGAVVTDHDDDGVQDLAVVGNGNPGRFVILRGGGLNPDSGNLLVNGGAESGVLIRVPNGTAPFFTGWSKTGQFSQFRYGTASGFPGRLISDRLAGGEAFFAGGRDAANSWADQVVDVSSQAAAIDSGRASYRLRAWLGGLRDDDDAMRVTMVFRDAAGNDITADTIGPYTPAVRKNQTGLLPAVTSEVAPAGTRSIRVRMFADHQEGTRNDAYADRVGLFQTIAPVPPAPQGPVAAPPAPTKKKACKKKKARGKKAGASAKKCKKKKRKKS